MRAIDWPHNPRSSASQPASNYPLRPPATPSLGVQTAPGEIQNPTMTRKWPTKLFRDSQRKKVRQAWDWFKEKKKKKEELFIRTAERFLICCLFVFFGLGFFSVSFLFLFVLVFFSLFFFSAQRRTWSRLTHAAQCV